MSERKTRQQPPPRPDEEDRWSNEGSGTKTMKNKVLLIIIGILSIVVIVALLWMYRVYR